MVKTRHSGDIDVESPPKFLSLANEKSRQSLKSGDATGDGSGRQSTGAYGDSRDAYSIFEEKVVESRLRPRIGPSRAYNYLDVDSSDEEIIRGRRVRRHSLDEFSSERRRSGYSRSRQIKQELLDEQQGRSRRMLRGRRSSREELEMSMEDEDFEEPNNHRRKRRNHSEVLDESEDRGEDKQMRGRMTRRRQHSMEDDQEDSEISQRRNPRRRQQGSREDDKERVDSHTTRAQGSTRRQLDTTEEDEEHLIRRSSRTRRQVYDTLNQSFLVNIPGRSKNDSDDNQDHSDGKDQDTDDNKEFSDMYSRVKRKRVQVKRNMYGVPVNDDSDSDQDIAKRNKNNNKQDDEEDDDEEENEEDEEEENDKDNRRITRQNRMPLRKKQPEIVKSYSLREHKPRTDLYKAPVEERRIKRIHHSIFAVTPTKKNTSQTYHSPAQRRNIRKRSALHSSSSSTSSSESESNDEKSFRRRKAKSMAKARSRMMPMNFAGNDIPSASVLKDRIKSGASLADVEPMNIDRSVTFNSIGGLGKHIRALKEMVVFPLLYDKVFQRFKVDPPRGVLFYGPPGTGKTLVARALANECSQGERRVAFFMRKGADCLSKWVGESERQLRLLFDQAYKFRPSIIFFDEIDGLAPVRSSRQDQIHSSIVSTLLALMDGLDSRGEIVVIGATNRIDSLDPALRRPGRFDREFFFPLPSLEARKQILKIHTTCWTPKLNDQFTSELAEKCVGYCGADLKALCTEAAMLALRRRYPQIYITNEALQLDVSSINVSAKDFFDAIGNIIPTSQRAVNTPARALTARVYPLLQRQLDKVLNQLSDMFPLCLAKTASLDAAVTTSQAEALAESGFIWEELASDEDEDAPSIFVPSTSSKGSRSNRRSTEDGPSTSSQTVPTYLNFTSYATSRPATFRPRLMLVGKEGQGQTTYIAPAVVHKMENLPVHVLDLPALYAVTAKTPEESCANVFHEAKRKCPSIVYLPYINQWWDVMAETLRATLLTLIQDLDPTIPLLLLATSEQPYHTLDPQLQCLFSQISGEVIQMTDPNMEERRTFFKDLLLRQACRPPPQKKQAGEILKLLRESKKAEVPNRMTKLKEWEKEKSCPPKYIYPFGLGCAGGDDNFTSKITKFEASRKNNWQPVKPHGTVRGLKCRSTKLDDKFDLPQKAKIKMSQVTVKIAQKPSLMRPSVHSTHPMTLRSQGNLGKLNSNQSAREHGHQLISSIYKSYSPASAVSDRHVHYVHRIKNINIAEHCVSDRRDKGSPGPSSNYEHGALMKLKTSKQDPSMSRSKLTDRQDHYLRHIHKLESKIEKVRQTFSTQSSKSDMRNDLGPLSARHLRYLRRLNRVEAVLGHKSTYDLELPHCSYMPNRETSRIMSSRTQSLLSCGSFQMLYRDKESYNSGAGTRKYQSELVLPLNFRDLQNVKRGSTSVSSYGNQDTDTEQMKSASKRKRKWIEVPCIPYNLRPRKFRKQCAQRMLEVLPKAAAPKPRELTKEELKALVEKEELTLMELRIFLRDVLNKLGSDKKFSIFAKPVNIEDAPDYYEIIEQPMDLSTMMGKIDLHEYNTVRAFMHDIDLICSNALEYNPNRGPMDRVIRHRACALKDTAYAIIKTELDKDFEKTCVEIEESRKRRGEKSTTIPDFYYTRPKNQQQTSRQSQPVIPSYLQISKPVRSIPKPEGERFSRRVRGLTTDPVPALETVEKVYRISKSCNSPTRDKNNSNEDSSTPGPSEPTKSASQSDKNDHSLSVKKDSTPVQKEEKKSDESKSGEANKSSSASSKKRKNKCVWCRPRRKRPKILAFRQASRASGDEQQGSGDEQGEEEMSAEEEEDEQSQDSQGPETSEQLVVDTSEHDESADLKSPSRISTRKSPATSNPGSRVSTRRSSMSPHSASHSHTSPSTQTQGNTDHTESSKEVEETTTVTQSTSPAEKEKKTGKPETDTGTHDAEDLTEPIRQNSSPPSEPLDKSRVVKRLDLDSVAVDSGVGSSVDSNGDSRDSMDHRGEGDSSIAAASVFTPAHTPAQDSNQNCTTTTELQNKASAILNEPNQKIVVDNNRLSSLLNRLVARTDGYNVERLEKIYSHLSQIIYRHRHEYNRAGMIVNLERKVDELTKIHPPGSSTTPY